MSFASRMLIKLLQVSGMKGKLARGSQKTFEEAVSYNRKHPFVMPEDHKAIYEQINIRTGFGVYPCLKISQSDSCRDRAVLFCVLIGMIPALVLSAILGLNSALGSAIGTMFLCFGNAFMFGGLLATLPDQESFDCFQEKISKSKSV